MFTLQRASIISIRGLDLLQTYLDMQMCVGMLISWVRMFKHEQYKLSSYFFKLKVFKIHPIMLDYKFLDYSSQCNTNVSVSTQLATILKKI